MIDRWPDDTHVDDIGLSAKARNALRSAGIKFVHPIRRQVQRILSQVRT